MVGTVYTEALAAHGIRRLIPAEAEREMVNRAIFEELCLGVFSQATTARFVGVISDLAADGADCVILGCTEIPLIISDANSPLPVLDSTRLLARYAVEEAARAGSVQPSRGWLQAGVRG